jgi:hypothetical protein
MQVRTRRPPTLCRDQTTFAWLAALIAARNPITALPPHQTLHLDQATTEGGPTVDIAEPLVSGDALPGYYGRC